MAELPSSSSDSSNTGPSFAGCGPRVSTSGAMAACHHGRRRCRFAAALGTDRRVDLTRPRPSSGSRPRSVPPTTCSSTSSRMEGCGTARLATLRRNDCDFDRSRLRVDESLANVSGQPTRRTQNPPAAVRDPAAVPVHAARATSRVPCRAHAGGVALASERPTPPVQQFLSAILGQGTPRCRPRTHRSPCASPHLCKPPDRAWRAHQGGPGATRSPERAGYARPVRAPVPGPDGRARRTPRRRSQPWARWTTDRRSAADGDH